MGSATLDDSIPCQGEAMDQHFEPAVQQAIEQFLSTLRSHIDRLSLTRSRLPHWLTCATVRVAWIGESIVAVFEDAPFGTGGDTYEIRGPISADTVALLNTADFTPEGASLHARPDVIGIVVLQGTYGATGRTVINMTATRPALFDCGFVGYHSPLALCNLFLQHTPAGNVVGPVTTRFVSFALYVHAKDLAATSRVWEPAFHVLGELFVSIHGSPTGDFYEGRTTLAATLEVLKKSSVIVLGSYSSPQLAELIQVRDELRARGYDANLIRDLPETAEMSNEDKVRIWTAAARFCVMVDRVPSGHISEYMILREQHSILALLRPRGNRSTYMIGDEHLVNVNHIRLFEFRETPLTALNEVTQWAETIVEERAEAYDRTYPWRLPTDG